MKSKTNSLAVVASLISLWSFSLPSVAQPVDGPDLRVGDRFRYTGTFEGESPKKDAAGQYSPFPKSVDQTVEVVGEEPCGDHVCLVIESTQQLEPFHGKLPASAAHDERKVEGKAKVDKVTGELVLISRTIFMAGRVTPSEARPTSRNSQFNEFYGPWMLDLKEGSRQEYPLGNGGRRTFDVIGRERVGGSDCFVVDRTTSSGDGPTTDTRYWVDVERRIVVQVTEGNWRLTLDSSTPEPESGG